MKRFFIFVLGMVLGIYTYSQQSVQVWTEDFDGTVTFATPATNPPGLWVANTLYYYSTGSPVSPKSYHGKVPGGLGVTSVLESPPYDCTNYSYVTVRFNHICKVSPLDKARIEYRTSAGGGWTLWRPLPGGNDSYLGDATNYTKDTCFNAASYAEWQANDSTAFPPLTQTWWKEEVFDLTFEARNTPVQFRFVITHGNTASTQVSYGWLIDNFKVEASIYEQKQPEVDFLYSLRTINDTIYGGGPWTVWVKAAARTTAPMEIPWLTYTATKNNVSQSDSLPMEHVIGDSIWKITLPSFAENTTVSYSVTGKDIAGNYRTKSSSFIIGKPFIAGLPAYKTIGDEASTNWDGHTPIGTNHVYAWNKILYLASELGTTSSGALITALAWQSFDFNETINNQKCYVRAVTNTNLSTGAFSPEADGALKVFEGTISFSPGWGKLTFPQPFYLPPNMNLLVYWDNRHGVVITKNFRRTPTQGVNTIVDGWYPDSYSNGNAHEGRPNARFYFVSQPTDNSAAVYSIGIADTVIINSQQPVPVVAVIRNKGNLNLTTATVKCTVNNGAVQTVNYLNNAGLAWDMNDTVTFPTPYTPKLNGYDTITVWIEAPNGQTDAITYDDTLTKLIFGRGAMIVSFVKPLTDTVYNTGPFEINARITPISGISGQVTLEIKTLYAGTTDVINVPMTYDANMDLWKATIPQTQYGSDITYSIIVTDIWNNTITMSNMFFIRREGGSVSGEETLGTYTGTDDNARNQDNPIHLYHYNSWSKQLYLESEISDDMRGGTITKIAWQYASTYSFTKNNQDCYMRLVDDVDLNDATKWENWDDPANPANEMIKVWGTKTLSHGGGVGTWIEVPLDQSFKWDKGKNLLIYWVNNNNGAHLNNCNFQHTSYPDIMVRFTNKDNAPASAVTKDTDRNGRRPNLKLYMVGKPDYDTSVALVSIESPFRSETALKQVPIQVKIQNKGMYPLSSCTIKWTVNGGTANGGTEGSYLWDNDTLAEEFAKIITVGNYTPATVGQTDEFVIWVEAPNGGVEPETKDDTLRLSILSCLGVLQGPQIVSAEPGSDFNSIAAALSSIKECGLTGDLTLQLKGTFTENLDLSNITEALRGYKLTITSYDNDPDSAIIQPSSGVGIKLENTNDVTIQNITVNTESISTHAIQFTGASKNIVIRDCKLLTNPTTTSQIAPIYKAGSTELVDSIFIIGNTLNGGYYGFYFYGGIGTDVGEYGTNVVFDSNTVTNNYAFGTQVYYTDFLHISHNTVKSRATGTQKWVGMQMQNVNGDLIGNRILQFNPSIDMDGIYMKEYNWYLINKKALIANNEVIYQSTSNRGTGVYFNLVNADFLHNSIYLSSGGEVNGLYIETVADNNISIKNNNIVTLGNSGYVIEHYTTTGSTSRYDMDYNNFYSNRNAFIHYNSATLSTLAEIQQNYPTAQHNISLLPDYIDIDVNTALTLNNVQFYVPLLSNVLSDITGKTRTTHATIGAWQILPPTQDMGIIRFVDVTNEVVTNETVTVKVEVQNTGNTPITAMELGWSVNGVVKLAVPYVPQPALTYFNLETVTLGTFVVDTTTNVYEIVVWINSVNQTPEAETVNDTARMLSHRIQLVEWAAPLIEDTTYSSSFEVVARIRTVTGAPTSTPIKLTIANYVKDKYIVYDTLDMNFYDGVWRVRIPEQYQYSKVIFSITVSDTMYNTSTIIDSTFIVPLGWKNNPVLQIGTGTSTNYNSPYMSYSGYSASRNYYMGYDIDPDGKGAIIYSIAFYTTNNNEYIPDLSFYLKAVSDSTAKTGYVNPIGDGAILVWGPGTQTITTGWIIIPLNAPFYLPPGQNLLIYCDYQHGSTYSSYPYWRYTTISRTGTYYTWGSTFPSATGGTLTSNLPNLQLNVSTRVYSPYTGSNLEIDGMLNPVNDVDELCTPDYSPLDVIIRNTGTDYYNYAQDIVTVSTEIINPFGERDTAFTYLNIGGLASEGYDTITIIPALDIRNAGRYKIKVWLTSSIDTRYLDDTLEYEFISGRINLPIESDFTGSELPDEFVSLSVVGTETDVWHTWVDTNSRILPPLTESKGLLRYTGNYGTMARLTTRQLQLIGAVDAKAEFYYYHDTAANELDFTFTEVKVIVDGTVKYRQTLYRRANTDIGWTHYEIDLDLYKNMGQCIQLQFESVNRFDTASAQYLAHILITSTQDLELSQLIIDPEVTVCEMGNKQLKLVLATKTTQEINFAQNSATFIIDIDGTQQSYVLDNILLPGNTKDTIDILSGIDLKTIKDIKVYLMSPVDNYPVNDTAKYVMAVAPKLEIEVIPSTTPTTCNTKGMDVYQDIVLTNSGNIDLTGIELQLKITAGNNYEVIVKNPDTVDLAKNTVRQYSFKTPYTVPSEDYTVQVMAWLGCDSVWVNVTHGVGECANLYDLSLTGIVNPDTNRKDTVNTIETLIVAVENTDSRNSSFNDVEIIAEIEDQHGTLLNTLWGNIASVNAFDPITYTFEERYTVPNDSLYFIRVYINSGDLYPENDTLFVSRTTNYKDSSGTEPPGIYLTGKENVFALGQNIPNPATNSTRIDYTIPDAGEALFQVHSVNGQLLYAENINTPRGTHTIELNTATFAAGIYFYSIEYKGQKLVKKLTINN